MANGGYQILDLTKIKWRTGESDEIIGDDTELYTRLKANNKPLIIHGVNMVPNYTAGSTVLHDINPKNVNTTDEYVKITCEVFDIFVYADGHISLG